MSCSMDHLVNNGDEIQPEKFSSISSTNILTPIEGSNETFRQRQSDVFSALTSLEAAHREVYKATKEERKAVRKAAWRHTITAPENLAELKERRDHVQTASGKEHKTTCQTQNSTFRKPNALPPSTHRRPNYVHRDPSKWTHYSLADVNEDPDISDNSLAMALINELRQSRNNTETVQDDETCPTNPRHNNRILFRPTRGKKRARLTEENLPKPEVRLESCFDTPDTDESQSSTDDSISLSHNSESSCASVAVFVNRRHKGQIRNRHLDNPVDTEHQPFDDQPANAVAVNSDYDDKGDQDLDVDSDELEEDPEEDKTNDYLA
ncbi:hypothetical protein Smp_064390 [Schistosoma mansoni]|uniref:hypothetical protein n=1 Tax=Schistosoma mansoni TaxID=6183 RepID=UPI0001A62F68|nr:hypothetical protein Smp_064390 [Schistosoma mansoni]|eukprot:XP_018652736.1 hypothetical protein Smp_064390 [Schistosoma mansoni]